MRFLCALLLISLAGCAGQSDGEDGTSGESHSVRIENSAFIGQELTIRVGDDVTWQNQDSFAHTVTSNDGGPMDSGTMGAGDVYSFTFDAPGTYTYFCAIHPGMTGKITVV